MDTNKVEAILLAVQNNDLTFEFEGETLNTREALAALGKNDAEGNQVGRIISDMGILENELLEYRETDKDDEIANATMFLIKAKESLENYQRGKKLNSDE